jgi:hypothetical protein
LRLKERKILQSHGSAVLLAIDSVLLDKLMASFTVDQISVEQWDFMFSPHFVE